MKTQSSLLRPHDFLFLLLLSAYVVGGMALAPFHGDEATQIYMSHDYAYQFLQRDLSLVAYSDLPVSGQEQDLRLLNGTINKYLIGLAWHLGGFMVDDLNEQWDWGGDWNYNQQNNHAPSDALLLVSRLPSTLLLLVGLAALFGLGWQVGGRPVAYLAALFYALHPVLLLNGRRAMMEGSFIAFSLLTVLAAVWWLRVSQPSPPSPLPQGEGRRPFWQWIAVIALGLAAGLALASKHTAVFTVVAVYGACGLWVFIHPSSPNPFSFKQARRKRGAGGCPTKFGEKGDKRDLLPAPPSRGRGAGGEGKRSHLLQLVFSALTALLVFYTLNPVWWGDPVTRVGQVLERRQELLNEQVTLFGGYDGRDEILAGFWRQALIAPPQYYEVSGWENYIGDQITRYEASPWRGITVGGSAVGAAILVVLVVIGLWALLRTKDVPASTRWLVGIWALAMFFTTALLTPIEWQRYYLPVYPVVGLLAAMGVWRIVRVLSTSWLIRA